MIILGIDPGTATTGYAIIEEGLSALIPRAFGCILTSPHIEDAKRLKQIRSELYKIIRQYKPGLAAIERLFFATNVKTAISVAHARGVILETIASAHISVLEYTPLQVKQAVTGYGRADKSQVQKMVKILLKLDKSLPGDDAADALAIAICCAHSRPKNNELSH